MRTLLVDNHDSFTYNLFHYLAEVNGEEPVVVANDDPGWRPGMAGEFDNVVISPGPGTPDRVADFGICSAIIAAGEVPLLGVCLGHQGIALNYGAKIVHAPEPRHGRTSLVQHAGEDLFAGIPSPLTVVRYHSLMAAALPDELAVTAVTDGVVMGLRHRKRPQWGVQFHPESIAGEYGHELLANFRELTRRWQDASGVRPRPVAARAVPQWGAVDRVGRRRAVVLSRAVGGAPSAEAVFGALYGAEETAFWLDSSDDGGFSIMGDATGPLARVLRADVAGRVVRVGGTAYPNTFFDFLADDLAGWEVSGGEELPFDFRLGWVGYLGYELKAETGGAAVHRSPYPDAAMVFADRAVVVDHRNAVVYVLALAVDGAEEAAREWLDRTAVRVAAAVELPAVKGFSKGAIGLRHDRGTYLARIAECQEAIADGETYEVCLTNMVSGEADSDPWVAYRRLRRISPAPFAAYLRFPEVGVLSSSPERFLRVDAAGMVESKPIKGTRPRHSDPDEDERLRRNLQVSEKDRSENLMIVDLVRNDLGRCAEVGSVHVPSLFAVETYETAHQLVSTVRARLRPGLTAVDAVRAAFPGGSMTGAPKVRTMQIIDRLEGAARGVYSGAIGYFSLSGTADLSIVIRTLTVSGNFFRYGVGGAVVALSDPDDEFAETVVKCRPLLELLDTPFPGHSPAPIA